MRPLSVLCIICQLSQLSPNRLTDVLTTRGQRASLLWWQQLGEHLGYADKEMSL